MYKLHQFLSVLQLNCACSPDGVFTFAQESHANEISPRPLQSTLMRAIANGQVDGFPPKDVLRTVYVEHDIDGSLSDQSCVEFVFADADLQAAVATSKEEVVTMLSSVGFDDSMLVSGQWTH